MLTLQLIICRGGYNIQKVQESGPKVGCGRMVGFSTASATIKQDLWDGRFGGESRAVEVVDKFLELLELLHSWSRQVYLGI